MSQADHPDNHSLAADAGDAEHPPVAGVSTAQTTHPSPLSRAALEVALARRLQIDHPNIPKILSAGPLAGGKSGYITEALEPVDAAGLVSSWAALRDLIVTLLEASAAAHAVGVFHGRRDISSIFRRPDETLAFEGWLLDGGAAPNELKPLPDEADRDAELAPLTDLRGIGQLTRSLLDQAGSALRPPKGFNDWLESMTARHPTARPVGALMARTWLLDIDRLRRPVPMPRRYRPSQFELPEETATDETVDEGLRRRLLLSRPPLVGRADEKRQLWNAFRAAASGRRTLVLLRGHAGMGKTSLASWLQRRLLAGDHAGTLWLAHPDDPTPFSKALADAVGMAGADPSLRARQVERFLYRRRCNTDAARQLLTVLTHHTKPMSPRQQAEVATLFLTNLSKDAPFVLFLDDVHNSLESLRALENILVHEPRLNLLIVATLRPNEKRINPKGSPRLTRIETMMGVGIIDLAPLDDETVEFMAKRRYHLAPDEAAAMVEAVEGIPMIGVQWAERALRSETLEPTEAGFTVGLEELSTIPRASQAIFDDRLDAAIAAFPEDERGQASTLLSTLALLGPTIDPELLATIKRVVPSGPIQPTIDAFVGDRVLGIQRAGLRFDHGFMHEAVLRRGEGEQEARGLAIEALTELVRLGNRSQLRRLIKLLLADGQDESALGYLWVAVDEALSFGRIDAAAEQLEVAATIAEGLHKDVASGAQTRLRVLRSDLAVRQRRWNDALELLDGIRSETVADPQLRTRLSLVRATAQQPQDGHAATAVRLANVVAEASAIDSPILFGRAMIAAIRSQLALDMREDAAHSIDRALDALSDFDSQEACLRGQVLALRSRLELHAQQLLKAQASLDEAIRLDRLTGNGVSLHRNMSRLGDLLMASRHPREAAKLYQLAARGLMTLQRSESLPPIIGLGFVGVEHGSLEDVDKQLEQCIALMPPGEHDQAGPILCLKAWRAARTGDWAATGELAEQLESRAADIAFDLRAARCLGRTAILSLRAGRTPQAEAFFSQACSILKDLDYSEELDELRRRYRGISLTVAEADSDQLRRPEN